jgi:hypothetical protein
MKYLRIAYILLKTFITIPFRVLYAMFAPDETPRNTYSYPSNRRHYNRSKRSEIPEPFEKGKAFENYVRKYIFPKEQYVLLRKTHCYEENKNDYVEDSKLPDYTFRCKETNREFHVEVKFRSSLYDGKVQWCSEEQLTRYKGVAIEKATFLALGYGGTPYDPYNIYIIPLDNIHYTGLFPSFIDKYKVLVFKP